MKINELLGGRLENVKEGVYNPLDEFSIWTTNEERKLLNRLKSPMRLASLTEHDQFTIQALIRKSLVTKVGMNDPMVVANEKI